jgi:hypothetical protein
VRRRAVRLAASGKKQDRDESRIISGYFVAASCFFLKPFITKFNSIQGKLYKRVGTEKER